MGRAASSAASAPQASGAGESGWPCGTSVRKAESWRAGERGSWKSARAVRLQCSRAARQAAYQVFEAEHQAMTQEPRVRPAMRSPVGKPRGSYSSEG